MGRKIVRRYKKKKKQNNKEKAMSQTRMLLLTEGHKLYTKVPIFIHNITKLLIFTQDISIS